MEKSLQLQLLEDLYKNGIENEKNVTDDLVLKLPLENNYEPNRHEHVLYYMQNIRKSGYIDYRFVLKQTEKQGDTIVYAWLTLLGYNYVSAYKRDKSSIKQGRWQTIILLGAFLISLANLGVAWLNYNATNNKFVQKPHPQLSKELPTPPKQKLSDTMTTKHPHQKMGRQK